MERYKDMLDLPHYELKNHHPMPVEHRASQFAPFAALNGYEEAIFEAKQRAERMQWEDGCENNENNA